MRIKEHDCWKKEQLSGMRHNEYLPWLEQKKGKSAAQHCSLTRCELHSDCKRGVDVFAGSLMVATTSSLPFSSICLSNRTRRMLYSSRYLPYPHFTFLPITCFIKWNTNRNASKSDTLSSRSLSL